MMTRRRGLALMLAVCALLVAAPVAPANDGGSGCGETSTVTIRSRACPFLFRGFPINFSGIVWPATGSATVTIRVWVTDHTDEVTIGSRTGHDPYVIAECRSQGAALANCEGDWPTSDQLDLVHPLLTQLEHLVCHVEARIVGSSEAPLGRYSCKSSRGWP